MKELARWAARLEHLIKLVRTDYRGIAGLVRDDELMEHERKAQDEVWIASHDLLYDASTFLPVVRQNAQRGVTYKYLIPNSPEVVERFRDLKRHLNNAPSITARKYPHPFPFEYEWGVYSPEILEKRQGFVVTPEFRSEFNFFLSREMTDRLYRIFHHYWRLAEPVD